MKLRDYQAEVVQKVLQSDKKEIIIELPTGAGKSVIISELAKRYQSQYPVVVLTETSALIDQLDNHLSKAGFAPNIIKAKKHRSKSNNVYLIMEQSFHSEKRRLFKNLKRCVLIRDEIHKGKEGKRFKEIVQFLEPQKIIGLSATPYDEKGKYCGGSNSELIVGATALDLIAKGYLCKPKYHVVKKYKIDESQLQESGNDYNLEVTGELLSKEEFLTGVVQLCKQIDLKHTMIVCSSINQCEATYEAIKQINPNGTTVHSKKSDEFNEKAISMFKKGELDYIISVSKLTTGFDAPITRNLIVLRPTKVKRLHYQILGRNVRKYNPLDALLEKYSDIIEH